MTASDFRFQISDPKPSTQQNFFFQISDFRFQKRANPRAQVNQSGDRSSLIFAQNSGRRFQTHISNSGEQIPKHARQNSEGGRFPVSHYKTRSRGHRFLGTDFSILISEFKFPARPRIWEASHFSFLDSQCKSKDAHGLEIAQFEFLISRFTILVSKRPLQIPNPPAPRFSFRVSGFQRRPPFMGSEASTFLDSDFSILIAQIAEN